MTDTEKRPMACKATLCMYNDFGYCVKEKPSVVTHYELGEVCYSYSPDVSCEAAEACDARKFIHV